jgi:hypothetical protein
LNIFLVSLQSITDKNINLKDLYIEDLFDDDLDENDLIFNIEHYSNNDNTIKLLECNNCRLGSDLYMFYFHNKLTLFEVTDTTNIIINENKIKLFGWDVYVSISLKTGKIKTTETR